MSYSENEKRERWKEIGANDETIDAIIKQDKKMEKRFDAWLKSDGSMMPRKMPRKAERVDGSFGPISRFSVSSSKGDFNKDIWKVESYQLSTEQEATEFAREVWGDRKAEVRNMSPYPGSTMPDGAVYFAGRVFGVSGYPKYWAHDEPLGEEMSYSENEKRERWKEIGANDETIDEIIKQDSFGWPGNEAQ